jgi:hypothetical protein
MKPIFIPSKGRAETISSHKFFPGATIVVEPQEKYLYAGKIDHALLTLPEAGMGIAYVRNFILNHARARGLTSYWMLDDDIKKFTFLGKDIAGVDALDQAEKLLSQVPKLGQGGLEYGQFSWGAKKPLSLLGYCDVAVFMNVRYLGKLEYRSRLDLKEDRDFTLQVLASGHPTARASQYGFVAPKNGSNAGGLKDVYAQGGREAEASRRMALEWPGICLPHTKPDGRPDVKINWKRAYSTRINAPTR